MKITIAERQNDISCDEIASVVRRAYAVWDEKGYDYAARKYEAADIEKLLKEGTCLLAFADDKLAGVLFYFLGKSYPDLGTKNSVHSHIAAVAPEYKGNKIGIKLFEEMFKRAKTAGCGEYVGDTCAKNKELLKWYRKMGCEVVGFTSYPNTGYYSAIFMKPLNASYSKGFYFTHKIKGWIKAHLLYNADGSLRTVAKAIRKLKTAE